MHIDPLTPTDVILTELGQRLERLRRQCRFSQEQLAKDAGIGVATLRRIEAGNDGRLGSWLRLLKALGMTHAVEGLLPEDLRSPMEDVRRAKKRSSTRKAAPGFVWGDEQP